MSVSARCEHNTTPTTPDQLPLTLLMSLCDDYSLPLKDFNLLFFLDIFSFHLIFPKVAILVFFCPAYLLMTYLHVLRWTKGILWSLHTQLTSGRSMLQYASVAKRRSCRCHINASESVQKTAVNF
uniref:Uncharacterized protein n=1 Tax=Glossina austeni TaxID=7395 RepID=A0A1A9V430_GLOAU